MGTVREWVRTKSERKKSEGGIRIKRVKSLKRIKRINIKRIKKREKGVRSCKKRDLILMLPKRRYWPYHLSLTDGPPLNNAALR